MDKASINSQYPSTPVPQYPSTPVPQYPSTPVPQYPSTPVPLCLLFLICSFNVFADDCKISFKSLTKCDSKNLLVPQNYPAQILYIQNLSLDEIVQVAKGMDGTPTRLQVSSGDYKKIKEKAKKDPVYAQIINSNHFYVGKGNELSMGDGASGYAREGVIYGFDPFTKSVVLNAVTNDDSNRSYGESVCGLKLKRNVMKNARNNIESSSSDDFNTGSHILSIPGGACLSSNLTSKEFVKSICGSEANLISLETGYSDTKSLDEMVNIVPNPNNKCGFSIVSSSPARGLDILRKNPETMLFSESGIQLLSDVRKKKPGALRISGACTAIMKLKYLKKIQDGILNRNNKTESVKGITKLFDKIFTNMNRAVASDESPDIEEINKWASSTFSDLQINADRLEGAQSPPISDCKNLRNKDYLELFSYEKDLGTLIKWMQDNKQVYANKVKEKNCDKINGPGSNPVCLRLYNVNYQYVQRLIADTHYIVRSTNALQDMQDRNWQKIKSGLPSDCQNDQVKIDLPVILGSYYGGISNPIPTDLVVSGHSAVVPLQTNEAFSKDITSQLKESGLDTLYINTLYAHEIGGNIHSRSNEVRVCQP